MYQVLSSIKRRAVHYHQLTVGVFHSRMAFTDFVGMAILNGHTGVKILFSDQPGGKQVFFNESITCLKIL